jgi:hypothetical protein
MLRVTLSILAPVAAVAVVSGCGGQTREASTATITSGPTAGERELSRTRSAIGERLAFQLCLHEASCGRAQTEACIDETATRAEGEVASWSAGCDPASIRARAEECLAAVRAESCATDLKARARICQVNDACTNANAQLESPGPALAEIWRR